MDPGDQRITLDDFSLWKIEALRSFLSCRGLSTTGGGGSACASCSSKMARVYFT